MRWPWQRDAHPAESTAPAAAAGPASSPSPMGWAFLPPLQRTLATPIQPVTRPTEFARDLPAWRNPSFSSPLTHLVADSAPSGLIDGDGSGVPTTSTAPRPELTLLPPPRPTPVQRRAMTSTPSTPLTRTPEAGMPVVHRSAVEDSVPEPVVDHEQLEPDTTPGESADTDASYADSPLLARPQKHLPGSPHDDPGHTAAAMPVQRSAAPSASRPRLGLGAPLPAMPTTALEGPPPSVQRSADSPSATPSVQRSPMVPGPGVPAAPDSPTSAPPGPPVTPSSPGVPAALALPLPPATHAGPPDEDAPVQRASAAPDGPEPAHSDVSEDILSPATAPAAGASPPDGPASSDSPLLGDLPVSLVSQTATEPPVAATDGSTAPATPDSSASLPLATPVLSRSVESAVSAAPFSPDTATATPTAATTASDPDRDALSTSDDGAPWGDRGGIEASESFRATPLPLTAGLPTSIQRASVLSGAGLPRPSLVVRPTRPPAGPPSSRPVPIQRIAASVPGLLPAPASPAARPQAVQRGLFGTRLPEPVNANQNFPIVGTSSDLQAHPTPAQAMSTDPSMREWPSAPPLQRMAEPALPSMPTVPALQRMSTTSGTTGAPVPPSAESGARPPQLPLAAPPHQTDQAEESVHALQRADAAGEAAAPDSTSATEVPIGGDTGAAPAAASTLPAAGPAGPASPGGAAGGKSDDMEAMAQKLLKPMLRRIKAELLLDRERHGVRTDTW